MAKTPLTHTQLIKLVASRANVSRREARQVLNGLASIVRDERAPFDQVNERTVVKLVFGGGPEGRSLPPPKPPAEPPVKSTSPLKPKTKSATRGK